MGTFKIEIQEFLSRIIEVNADSMAEAILEVERMYHNEVIVLTPDDFVTTKIEVLTE